MTLEREVCKPCGSGSVLRAQIRPVPVGCAGRVIARPSARLRPHETGSARVPRQQASGLAGRPLPRRKWLAQHIAALMLAGWVRRTQIAQSFSTFQNTIESGTLSKFLRLTRIADGLFHTPQGM